MFSTLRRNFAKRVIVLAAVAGLAAGCAHEPTEVGGLRVNDPYEGINRDIHGFNKGVDRYFIRPISQGYDAATPGLVRLLVGNGLSHLELPRDFVNHLLQGELMSAGRTLLRFGVNTIVGAGGLLDPATDFEIEKEDADFGQTLAVWGADEGVYYEIPLLGPSTIRHTTGRVVDLVFAPTTFIGAPYSGLAKTSLEIVELRSNNGELIDSIYYDSADSYSTLRALYYQNRRRFVSGGVDLNGAPQIDEELN